MYIQQKRVEYNNRPEVREHKKKWRKGYLKKYYKRPYVDKKRKKYFKEYYNRPEIKERQRKYYKKYYIENKEKYVECNIRRKRLRNLNSASQKSYK